MIIDWHCISINEFAAIIVVDGREVWLPLGEYDRLLAASRLLKVEEVGLDQSSMVWRYEDAQGIPCRLDEMS